MTSAVDTFMRVQLRRRAIAESMISVMTASSITKVEPTPTMAIVRKNSADQKFAPGIWLKASG